MDKYEDLRFLYGKKAVEDEFDESILQNGIEEEYGVEYLYLIHAETLNQILLNENACKKFILHYKINKKFREWMKSLFIDDEINLNVSSVIEDCMDCPQNCDNQIYSVMNHCLHSVEKMNGLTKNMDYEVRKILAYTMFLHDLGKPAIRKENVLGERKFDTFPGHNEVSCVYSSSFAKNIGLDEYDIYLIYNLVLDHDVFENLRSYEPGATGLQRVSKQWVRDEINRLDSNINSYFREEDADSDSEGNCYQDDDDSDQEKPKYDKYKLMEFLLLVFEANYMAQNPDTISDKKIVKEMIRDFLHEIMMEDARSIPTKDC